MHFGTIAFRKAGPGSHRHVGVHQLCKLTDSSRPGGPGLSALVQNTGSLSGVVGCWSSDQIRLRLGVVACDVRWPGVCLLLVLFLRVPAFAFAYRRALVWSWPLHLVLGNPGAGPSLGLGRPCGQWSCEAGSLAVWFGWSRACSWLCPSLGLGCPGESRQFGAGSLSVWFAWPGPFL